jgi:hypothetical protein
MSSQIRLPIRPLLEFFDESPEYAKGHITAVNAVLGVELGTGLLVDYFHGKETRAEVLDFPCTQGKASGKKLDRWVRVTKGRQTVYYQVEVKNWSAAATGGRRIAVDASAAQLRKHKVERWSKEWNDRGFIKESVQKVLTPMKPPVIGVNVEPLVCYWDAMHPTGKAEALFAVPVPKGKFTRVWIFSMSSHLRNLCEARQEYVNMDAPVAKARLQLLNSLIGK